MRENRRIWLIRIVLTIAYNESERTISFYKGETIRGLINSRNRGCVSPRDRDIRARTNRMELMRTRDNASFVIFEFIFRDRNKFRHMLHIFEDLAGTRETNFIYLRISLHRLYLFYLRRLCASVQ